MDDYYVFVLCSMSGKPLKFYAVRRGRVPGIYTTWQECNKQTWQFNMARFKSFETMEEANLFMTERSISKNSKIKREEKQLDNTWSARSRKHGGASTGMSPPHKKPHRQALASAKRAPSFIQKGAERQAVERTKLSLNILAPRIASPTTMPR